MSPRLILASGSPRRKELLAKLGVPFEVITSGVEEKVGEPLSPSELVKRLALMKARSVSGQIGEGLVIGSDTAIFLDDDVLGKPTDKGDAFRILLALRGRTHQVMSGVALIDALSGKEYSSYVATNVTMRDYADGEIQQYIETGEPMDKAGSYGIQGKGGELVARIDGCYNNIVGFPLCEVSRILSLAGVTQTVTQGVCLLPSGEPCPRSMSFP